MVLDDASYNTTAEHSRSQSPGVCHVFNANDSHRNPPDAAAIYAADEKLEELRKIRIASLIVSDDKKDEKKEEGEAVKT